MKCIFDKILKYHIKKTNFGKEKVYMIIILLVALYLRLRYITLTPFEFKVDAYNMYLNSKNLLEGNYYFYKHHWSGYAYWPPGYIFFMSFILKIFGDKQNFMALRVIQSIVSSVGCIMCYLITKEILNNCLKRFVSEISLVSGIIMAVNTRLVLYNNDLYCENIFITIYLFIILMTIIYYKDFPNVKFRVLVIIGISLGIANLIRPVMLLFPGIIVVFLIPKIITNLKVNLKIFARNLITILLLMGFTIAPWTVRNYLKTNKFILIDSNGGLNFRIAHNPMSSGWWVDISPLYNKDDLLNVSETGFADGLKYMVQNPKNEINGIMLKNKLFWNENEYLESWYSKYITEAYRLPFYKELQRIVGNKNIIRECVDKYYRIPQIGFSQMTKVFFMIMFILFIKLLVNKQIKFLSSTFFLIILNVLYNNFIICIFYFAPRYRMLVEPFIIASISIAIGILINNEDLRIN